MIELIIFAGGLGSRLNGTEAMPKPLVTINGTAMLSMIIREFDKTQMFNKYNILISDKENLYRKWKNNEMREMNIRIINEKKRTGRTGALKNFLQNTEEKEIKEVYAMANGDTIIQDIKKANITRCMILNDKKKNPAVLVVRGDSERKDAHAIKIKNRNFFNSGFLVMNRSWIEYIVNIDARIDIDDYIFKTDNYEVVIAESAMVDIGTPDRLKMFREATR